MRLSRKLLFLFRRRQFERARRACQEKALLRSLGANSSHPHSWEDLAAFISL